MIFSNTPISLILLALENVDICTFIPWVFILVHTALCARITDNKKRGKINL